MGLETGQLRGDFVGPRLKTGELICAPLVAHHGSDNSGCGIYRCKRHAGNFFASAHTRSDPRQKQKFAYTLGVRKCTHRFNLDPRKLGIKCG